MLAMLGLKNILEDTGVRGFRQIIKRYGNPTWYSLNKEMQKLKTAEIPSIFTLLRKEITIFKPLKLFDFQDQMINNDKYN